MAISPLAAGKQMGRASDWTLTNMAMQKLLYIAHMLYMGERDGEPLVKGTFEAWEYGPVHPTLYHAVKQYGAEPIPKINGSISFNGFNNPIVSIEKIDGTPEAEKLDKVVGLLANNVTRLVAITHWDKGAWKKCYRPEERGVPIPNEVIMEEYRERRREPQR